MATRRAAFATEDDIESGSGGADDHGVVVDEKKVSGDAKNDKAGHDFALSSGADLPSYETDGRERLGAISSDGVGDSVVTTAEDLITRVIDLEDDPTQNPWTFRVFFLGAYSHRRHTVANIHIAILTGQLR
jgi:hypothetical protein